MKTQSDDREPAAVTVAVVEDHPLYRDALVRIVGGAPDLEVVVAVPTLESLEQHETPGSGTPPADVVVLDLHLPGLQGPAGVARLADAGRVVLALSAVARPELVAEVVAAGARGYLTKDADGEEVVATVRLLAAGGRLLPAGLPAASAAGTRARAAAGGLTHREVEVLARLAQGQTDQEIASALVISVRTVGSHLDRIREKTGRRRRPDLTRLAYEAGIVGPTPGH